MRITVGGMSAAADAGDAAGLPPHRLSLRRLGAGLLLVGIVLLGLAWPML